jgi:TRAP-type C4-dicarboxylate transport system permease small subunit
VTEARDSGQHSAGLTRLLDTVGRIEAALLITLFASLVIVAVYQILARNVWGGGLGWGDAFVRTAVLWVTVIGALVASRNDDHIRIDLIARYLPTRAQIWVRRLGAAFAGVVSGMFAVQSTQFVRYEFEDGPIAFGIVPAWACEIVLPIGFALIAIKYVLRALVGPR